MATSYTLIESQTQLDEAVEKLLTQKVVALDTEFKRTNTYWPKLGLVQVCWGQTPILIDPLKKDICYKSFFRALSRPDLLKILHAPYEDIEVLMPYVGMHLAPIFDTQLASAFCGLGENTGYELLVNTLMGVQVSKGCQKSEWIHRPLSQSQMTYAAQDVLYLIPIYNELESRLRSLERFSWFEQEILGQFAPGFLEERRGRLPKKLSFQTRDSAVKQTLRQITSAACLWREDEAQRRNLPRKWVLSDSEMTYLVENRHMDIHELTKNPRMSRLVEEGNLPHIQNHFKTLSGIPVPASIVLSSQDQIRLDSLKSLLYKESQQMSLPPSLIAKNEDLLELLQPDCGEKIPKLLKGWRKEAFGSKALSFLSEEKTSSEHDSSHI